MNKSDQQLNWSTDQLISWLVDVRSITILILFSQYLNLIGPLPVWIWENYADMKWNYADMKVNSCKVKLFNSKNWTEMATLKNGRR